MRFFARRLGLPVLGAVVLVLSLNHHSGGVAVAFMVVAGPGVIYAIEIPLILAVLRRRQDKQLTQAPAGTVFAGQAGRLADRHTARAAGLDVRSSATSRLDVRESTLLPSRKTKEKRPFPGTRFVRYA